MPCTCTESASLHRVDGCGLSLAYREWNRSAAGEPLLLLHGVTGSSADWEPTVSRLDGQRTLALDARGHGASEWDPAEAYGGDQHFADVAIVLDKLSIERCSLVGFSMGAGVAMLTAACLPNRISGVVIVDAYPSPEMTPGSRRIARWLSTYADNEAAWFDPAIARHFRAQLAAGHESRLDLWSMWEAIQCPVLIVRGAESDVLPRDMGERMLACQPRSQLVEIEGISHAIPMARPAELATTITDFLAGLHSQAIPMHHPFRRQ